MPHLKHRSLVYLVLVLLAMAGGVLWIQTDRIEPLATPPSSAPPGLHLSWAGEPIRGYAETVTTHVSDCSKPASLRVVLYPPVGRPWRPAAAGRVALAVSGAWASQLPRLHFHFSNTVGLPVASAGTTVETVPASGRIGWKSFAFMFDPRRLRDIEVSFTANWLAPRDDGSCWVNLPALLGGDRSSTVANEAIGRPTWALDERGAPLSSAENQLETEGATTLANPTNSIPLPSELSGHTWLCSTGNETSPTCEAFVSLEHPGAAANRVRELSQWTLLESALVALICALLVPTGHTLVQLIASR